MRLASTQSTQVQILSGIAHVDVHCLAHACTATVRTTPTVYSAIERHDALPPD